MIFRIFCEEPALSDIVPVTINFAPLFTSDFAWAGVLIPPPTMTAIFVVLVTISTRFGETIFRAPDPASRYTYRIPRYSAARAYIAASSGLSFGIGFAFPTKPAAPEWFPIIRYARGIGSSRYRLTKGAPRACAPDR